MKLLTEVMNFLSFVSKKLTPLYAHSRPKNLRIAGYFLITMVFGWSLYFLYRSTMQLFYRPSAIFDVGINLFNLITQNIPTYLTISILIFSVSYLAQRVGPKFSTRAILSVWFGISVGYLACLAISILPEKIWIVSFISAFLVFVQAFKKNIKKITLPKLPTEKNSKRDTKNLGRHAAFSLLIGFWCTRLFLSPIFETDSLLYHAGLARAWIKSFPDYPSPIGTGVGSEISFAYPNLLSGGSVFISKLFSIDVEAALHFMIILSLITVIATCIAASNKLFVATSLFLITIPYFAISAAWVQGYAVSGSLAVLAAYFLFREKNPNYFLFMLSIIAVSGVSQLIFSISLFLTWVIFSKLRGLKDVLFKLLMFVSVSGPVFLLLAIRNNSIFYPFVSWPGKFSSQEQATLKATTRGVVANGFNSLGGFDGSLFGPLFKYLFIPKIIFPGGLLALLTIAIVILFSQREKNRELLIVLMSCLIYITVIFLLKQYWIRYQVTTEMFLIAAIMLSIWKVVPAHEWKNKNLATAITMAVVSLLAFRLVIFTTGSSDPSSPVEWSSFEPTGGSFPSMDKLLNPKYNFTVQYGTRPQAWSYIQELNKNSKAQVGLFDEVAQSVIGYSANQALDGKSFLESALSTNKALRKIRQDQLGYFFVPGFAIDLKKVAPQFARSFYFNKSSSIFTPCMAWPGQNIYVSPNVLWAINPQQCPGGKVNYISGARSGQLNAADNTKYSNPKSPFTSTLNIAQVLNGDEKTLHVRILGTEANRNKDTLQQPFVVFRQFENTNLRIVRSNLQYLTYHPTDQSWQTTIEIKPKSGVLQLRVEAFLKIRKIAID